MLEFIWNIHQEKRLQEVKSTARHSQDELSRYKQKIEELEFSLSRITLASQAMWEVLRARAGVTDTELLAKMNEIDLRDGVKDGRMTANVVTCPRCARKLNTKSARCIYCGTTMTKPHVFQ